MTLALHPARHPDGALAAARWPVQAAVLAAWPWLLSLAIGVTGALALFPVPVLLGTAPFWTLPRGIVGGSWADMEIALSGYDAFVRGAWGWPVFHIAGLGGAAGTQAIFTDRTRLPVQACSRLAGCNFRHQCLRWFECRMIDQSFDRSPVNDMRSEMGIPSKATSLVW